MVKKIEKTRGKNFKSLLDTSLMSVYQRKKKENNHVKFENWQKQKLLHLYLIYILRRTLLLNGYRYPSI